jgi:hypothetical protein
MFQTRAFKTLIVLFLMLVLCTSQVAAAPANAIKTGGGNPILVSPTDGQHLDNRRPEFDWNNIDGVRSYIFQISTDRLFSNSLKSIRVSDSSYVTTRDLLPNTLYFWRVRYNDPATRTVQYSEVFRFTTGNPPSVPVLLSPENQQAVTDTNVILDWRDSKLPNGVEFSRYHVEVYKVFPVDLLFREFDIYDVTNSQVLINNLERGNIYLWRVQSFGVFEGNDHHSGWSQTWSVRVFLDAPVLLTPADGEFGVPLKPTFTWDVVKDALSYDIQVSTVDTFLPSVIKENTLTPYFTPSSMRLEPQTTYYWRVRANGKYMHGLWSATFSFTTR